MKKDKILAPALLLLIGLAVICSTFRDYGITWDESAQSLYAEYVLDYFQTGNSKEGATNFLDMYTYGPLVDLAAAAIYQHTSATKYETRHFIVALTGLAAVLIVFFFGRRLGGTAVGIYAALALAMMPRFYGHSFNNQKDIPFAMAIALTLFMLTRISAFRAWAWRDTIWVGLAAGCALAIRAGGMVIMLLISLTIFGYDRIFRRDKPLTSTFAVKALVAFVIAWIVMIALWPYAQLSPILNPLRMMILAVSFPNVYPVFFEGTTYWSNELPRYYVIKFLLISTPPVVLALSAWGIVGSFRIVFRKDGGDFAAARAPLLIWLFLPLTMLTLLKPNVYDGIRMFLFLLPVIALFTGLGAYDIVNRLSARVSPRLSRVLIGAALLLPISSLVTLHPYQSSYFNVLAGGLEKASARYETDYWLSSYKEAAEWVNQRVERRKEKDVMVLTETSRLSLDTVAYYLDPAISSRPHYDRAEEDLLPEDVDYYISTTRFGLDKNFKNTTVLHTIEREGAVFTVIKGRKAE